MGMWRDPRGCISRAGTHRARQQQRPWTLGTLPGQGLDGDARSQCSPTGMEAAGGASGCWQASSYPPEVGRARWGDGTAGRWGCPRQPGEGADGAGWLLSRCHQSAPAPPSAAASPGCKSDLNEAEGFSARSGLAVYSGDSVATGRPCVPGKGRTGTSARGC